MIRVCLQTKRVNLIKICYVADSFGLNVLLFKSNDFDAIRKEGLIHVETMSWNRFVNKLQNHVPMKIPSWVHATQIALYFSGIYQHGFRLFIKSNRFKKPFNQNHNNKLYISCSLCMDFHDLGIAFCVCVCFWH